MDLVIEKMPCRACAAPTDPRHGATCRKCRRKARRARDGHLPPSRRSASRSAARSARRLLAADGDLLEMMDR